MCIAFRYVPLGLFAMICDRCPLHDVALLRCSAAVIIVPTKGSRRDTRL